jgi:integrase
MISDSNGQVGSPLGSPKRRLKAEYITLTDKSVKYLEPSVKRRVVWIKGLPGFGIRITPKGTKSFVYKYDFDGQDRWITFGQYPKLTLQKALEKYAEANLRVEAGDDPAGDSVATNAAVRKAPTVAQLVKDYVEIYAKPYKRSWKEDERILNFDILPKWGAKRVHSLKRRDVIALLDEIVARGSPIQANRTLATIRRMFNFAVDRDILETSPCHRVKPPAPESSKDRYLTLEEIKIFWNRIDTARLDKKTRMALKLVLLSMQRVGEVLGLHESELDLKNATWIIPKERTKNKQAHLVPLSPLAIEIITELMKAVGDDGFLFSSSQKNSHFKSSVLSHAVRRNLEHFGLPKFTPHDLRRTGSTQLAAFRVPRFDRERILNHADRTVGGVYDMYEYQDEKRAALILWADIIRHSAVSEGKVDARALQARLKYLEYFCD